nr:DNA mismatch repair protein mutL [Colletotrichum truncatum]KAF6792442.1 DNA mismatch repair protein mutL [Colletotrichum truncatum]
MPISQLPDATARLLGSSVLIVTPVSLVKELVDNAIDAGANAIEITVSANAVDRIQVRDDGHGINPEDYNALGRRFHTSKLRTFKELQCKGGQTLGFRGDALASTNILSRLTITTRTAKDDVAKLLVLNPHEGGIIVQKAVSAPVGTTVDARDIFSGLPVRRQQTIKDSTKFHVQIKELLHTYALTRPRIRLSLKILKNRILSWSYAPSRGANVREAVLQVFAGKGYFISVDSRPMTTTRGTMKKLTKIYKDHISNSLHTGASSKALKAPFIRVDIQCVIGSYDPNIATNKDEVLFANESKLLTLFENMCKEIYQPSYEPGRVTCKDSHNGQAEQLPTVNSFPGLVSDGGEKQMSLLIRGLGSGDDHIEVGLSAGPSLTLIDQQFPSSPPNKSHITAAVDAAGEPDGTVSQGNEDMDRVNGEGSHPSQLEIAVSQESPQSTQFPLRMGWEVDMTRSKTQSPEGFTQAILLDPTPSNIVEFLSTQRAKQTRLQNPNPWTLAKSVTRKGGEQDNNQSENLIFSENKHNSAGLVSRKQIHALDTVDLMDKEGSSLINLVHEDQGNSLFQRSNCFQAPIAEREGVHETGDLESSIFEHSITPHCIWSALRHQNMPGIPIDESQFQRFEAQHVFDGLPADAEKDPVISQGIDNSNPRLFTKFVQENAFGTPPPSSSPPKMRSRVPTRGRVGKRGYRRLDQATLAESGDDNHKPERQTQNKPSYNSTKKLESLGIQDSGIDSHSIMKGNDVRLDDDFVNILWKGSQRGHVSPSPTDKDINKALDRLNALRSWPEDVSHPRKEDLVEEQGKSIIRRSSIAAPDFSPQ